MSFERCVVLVVDDEPTVLKIVSHSLTRHGYVVIPASDGTSALHACQERDGPIHLALLDIMMPGMTGPELFECLLEADPKIAVLFMSGYGQNALASLPSTSKVHFIEKPFKPRDLVQMVNAILGNDDVCILLNDEAEAARA